LTDFVKLGPAPAATELRFETISAFKEKHARPQLKKVRCFVSLPVETIHLF